VKIRVHKATLAQELFAKKLLFLNGTFAVIYLTLTMYLLNYRLILQTMITQGITFETIVLFLTLPSGITTLFRPYEVVLLLSTGFLTAMNIRLLFATFRQQSGSLTFGFGLATAVSSSGCASCGLTLLSVLGPLVPTGLMPFVGVPLQLVSLFLLVFSLFYNLNRKTMFCRISR